MDSHLALDLGAMVEASRGAGLVYFCNPNNPTATVHSKSDVVAFIEQVGRASHRRLTRTQRGADPRELDGGLGPPAGGEPRPVRPELDPGGAQVVGDLDRKARRHPRRRDVEPSARLLGDKQVDLVTADAAAGQRRGRIRVELHEPIQPRQGGGRVAEVLGQDVRLHLQSEFRIRIQRECRGHVVHARPSSSSSCSAAWAACASAAAMRARVDVTRPPPDLAAARTPASPAPGTMRR